jgi:hypothetical protein
VTNISEVVRWLERHGARRIMQKHSRKVIYCSLSRAGCVVRGIRVRGSGGPVACCPAENVGWSRVKRAAAEIWTAGYRFYESTKLCHEFSR